MLIGGPSVAIDPRGEVLVETTDTVALVTLDQDVVAQAAQSAVLIIPAPTVTPVASSIRMNEPVVRFLE